jgi:Arc/MetJ-type ribon-helix-helix transcriptional regulator
MDTHYKRKEVMLINFKLNKHIVDVLDQLVQTGLFKSRVDVVLAALRNYEFFTSKWEELEGLRTKKNVTSE